MEKICEKFCRFKIKYYLCTRNRETTIANRFDSLAQQVEHNTFNVGVLGSSPKRITHTNGKTKKTADNQSLSAVFLCSPTCISGQNGAIKTGEIGGLDFRQNKVHLFVSYFSDFLYFANLQLPDKTVFLHPKN